MFGQATCSFGGETLDLHVAALVFVAGCFHRHVGRFAANPVPDEPKSSAPLRAAGPYMIARGLSGLLAGAVAHRPRSANTPRAAPAGLEHISDAVPPFVFRCYIH